MFPSWENSILVVNHDRSSSDHDRWGDHPNVRRIYKGAPLPRGGFHKLNYSDRRHFWLNVICPNLASDRPFRYISHESGDSRNFDLKKNAEVEHCEADAVDLTRSKSISGLGIKVVRYSV